MKTSFRNLPEFLQSLLIELFSIFFISHFLGKVALYHDLKSSIKTKEFIGTSDFTIIVYHSVTFDLELVALRDIIYQRKEPTPT